MSRAGAARNPLPHLTSAGIAALDGTVDAESLLASTSGNPFFVTEVLAAPPAEVPATVVDAVLARLQQLDPADPAGARAARRRPTPAGLELATALLGGLEALAEPERRGIVTVVDGAIAFRHKRARRAVERSLPLIRRIELNRSAVPVLRNRDGADLSLLVHHATQAGDLTTILFAGPAAAREAAKAAAHRQALAHYAAVLRHADRLSVAERAPLLEEYAAELYIAHRFGDSARAAAEAVALRRELGDDVALVRSLVELSRRRWMAGGRQGRASSGRGGRARRGTQWRRGVPRARRRASTVAARARSVGHRGVGRGCRRRSRAPAACRNDLLALCLNYRGSAQVLRGDDSGVAALRESLALALRMGDEVLAGRAYVNLGYSLYLLTRHDEIDEVLEEGLAFCRVRDLTAHGFNMRCTRAETLLLRGRYAEAEALPDALHADLQGPSRLDIVPRRALGVLLARRGLPGADDWLAPMLDEALEDARRPPEAVTAREVGERAGAGLTARRRLRPSPRRCRRARRCGRSTWMRPSSCAGCSAPGCSTRNHWPRCRSPAFRRPSRPGCGATGAPPRPSGAASGRLRAGA